MSSRGGGGNTIRNILTSSDSGISLEEEFDVDPYAMALTSRMISEEDSWSLPRKFKIAFSNSSKDSSFTQATCLGFIAINKEGQKGFRVYCAGGMGANPMIGNLLFDWVPDTQVYAITKALKIMFDRYGNRKQKSKNRIKFLWKKLEREDFLSKFMDAYEPLKDDESLFLELPVLENVAKDSSMEPELVSGEKFDEWKARFVKEQKQDRLYAVNLPLVKGDILKKDVDILCDFLAEIGENTIRCGRSQNIRLRNIPEKYLGNLFNLIMSMEMTLAAKPAIMSNMINCTGASTCKLGICLPRGLSDALRDSLTQSSLDLDRLNDFHLNMSGCPNTCGMHHIADLGFFGKVGRNDGNMYPVYNVLAGGKKRNGDNGVCSKSRRMCRS